MLYDAFICHASEDKRAFVRPFAEALRAKNVSVWYDEFELKLGQSIRQAIDRGLAQCRFGIVVLSSAFFAKEWPQYELDGLVDREMSSRAKLVLPIWHKVTHADVARYSPALAGRRAARSDSLEEVVQEIYDVVHPSGSPLLVARDALLEWDIDPPVITDPRWLEVVEASNRIPGYGMSIPVESTWTWWCFPLPGKGDSPEEWGERLAWSYMQLNWTETAERERITPLTEPTRVHEFIGNSPGLLETCELFLEFAIEYAPQLTIAGFEGPLASAIEKAFHVPSAPPPAGTTSCAAEWALRAPAFGGHDALTVASEYFYGGFSGPRVNPYELADNWSGYCPIRVRGYRPTSGRTSL